MNDENLTPDVHEIHGWRQHKFMLLVGMTIALSLILVSLSLWLYNASGAAQLDLSRPGYKSVRDKASKENDFTGFATSGDIDSQSLEEFRKLYGEQYKEATTIESFGGDVMSDSALGIAAP